MTKPLSKPPITGAISDGPDTGGQSHRPARHASRALAASMRDTYELLKDYQTGVTIADADGTLADLTTKFNALLAALRGAGMLEG